MVTVNIPVFRSESRMLVTEREAAHSKPVKIGAAPASSASNSCSLVPPVVSLYQLYVDDQADQGLGST